MNSSNTAPTKSQPGSFQMLRAMVGIGLLCALLIVLTFEGTKPVIAQNRAEALQEAVFQVLPGIVKKKTFRLQEDQTFTEVSDEATEGRLVHAGYDENDALVGIAIEASGMGYADVIRILYGYDPDAEAIIGFHVLQSKETPGLGTKIETDPDFLANFDGLDVSLNADHTALKHKIEPVKEGEKEHPWQVDGITGATISSQAVGNILRESTAFWIPLIYEQRAVFEID